MEERNDFQPVSSVYQQQQENSIYGILKPPFDVVGLVRMVLSLLDLFPPSDRNVDYVE
jgi:hypothetical protein